MSDNVKNMESPSGIEALVQANTEAKKWVSELENNWSWLRTAELVQRQLGHNGYSEIQVRKGPNTEPHIVCWALDVNVEKLRDFLTRHNLADGADDYLAGIKRNAEEAAEEKYATALMQTLQGMRGKAVMGPHVAAVLAEAPGSDYFMGRSSR